MTEVGMFADYHIHSEFSDDSNYKMEDIIIDAINIGLDEICFTEHVDYNVKVDRDEGLPIIYRSGYPMLNVDYESYIKRVVYLKEKYSKDISIKKGFEFGVQVHTVDRYNKLFKKYPMDFILLSIHQVENKEFWAGQFQEGRTQDEYNLRYYQELLEVVKRYKNYSVLGHVDVIKRYDKCGVYPFYKIKDILTEIFKVVIKDGKGIELNTSSKRYGLDETTPSEEILRLYKDLGGEIITIGSDSHKPGQLGSYIKESKLYLKSIGFKNFYTFNNMEPSKHII